MISKLNPLPKIPFVDGVPSDTTQTPINWIINGETLDGAKTKVTNEGSLNRCGVLVQKNAVQLETNTITQTAKINEVIDQVNLISENLAAISDESVIDKLDQVVADVEVLKVDMTAVQGSTASNTLKIQDLDKEIGTWDASTDPKHRTIRKDIIFLKGEMGAYPGFNENGDVDPTSTGSGMKYKIMTNAQAISIHEGRITRLEDDWANSDVGHLTDEVTDLRNEMGPKHLATFESVYVRLNTIGTEITGINSELTSINQYIGRTGTGGTGSISARMTTAESNIATLQTQMNDSATGVLPRVISLENAVGNSQIPGSIRYDISAIKRDIGDINMIVGESSDDGLRGEMAQVMTDIGTDSQPTSIKGRLLNVENTQRDDHQKLIDVESVVGNTSSGLVAANIAMGKAVYGDATSSDPFLKDGIQKTARDSKAAIGVNTTGSETGIYKLISDLTARVAALESGTGGELEQRVSDLETNKASHQDVANALVPYITEAEADVKYEPKKIPLSFTQNLVGRGDYIEGDDISFMVTVTGGKLPYVYQWKKGTADVGTNASSILIQSITSADAGVYKVVVTDADNTVITSDEVTVAVYPVPQFDTNLADKSVVDGDPLTLEVVYSGGKPPYTYEWFKDNSVISGETSATFTKSAVTSADAGEYYVSVTDAMNNQNDSVKATVTVTPRPALAFTTDLSATKSYSTGANMDLAVVVTGGKTPYTYKWFKDTAEISGQTGASLTTVAEDGVYKVEVTDALTTKITSTECTVTVA
ncbi:fibritin neck whisker [Citrobacter phage IME-CF2]|uniref:Neck whiskers protein n=5 Tax=Pseudotevenvirus TaxID=2842979 RepID=A0A1B1IX65_9CAUD|nr:fibritin neck whisker [Citrobacter phage Miller]YP_009218800.1 fibritin neck whisker [Citrobacter phage IME-CF2]YP_009285741.1 fibritin neck whisker [Citrobacter phage vB_CfrM_CfP1]YP_239189.1 fibritin neck whisker [Escherichia phage RB43]AAP04365.1 fibritin [Pseudotevenvirus RB43]QPX73203.1 putative whisker protein [Citrobacter phage vB_Cfr_Xman]AAX78735.1 Wac whiskers [Escherichia phage RB43]AIK68143.1 whisker protein [Citrobacter phage Miller]AKR16108.1 neck whiskers [Citrobacter phag